MEGPRELRDRVLLGATLAGLRAVANRYASSPLPEWDAFARTTRLMRYPARSVVEQSDHDVLILLSGLVKEVYDVPAIAGQISEFFVGGSVIATRLQPIWASSRSTPFSVSNLLGPRTIVPPMTAYAIEPTTVLRIDYRVVQRLSERYPQWGEVQTAFLWTYIEEQHGSILHLRTKDTVERYLQLMRRRGIAGRVNQRDIASYLGITESALSRLIKRVAGEGPRLESRAEGVDRPLLESPEETGAG